MSSAPLPVGVIGVGSFGFHHARLRTGVPGARLVGVRDERRDRAERVAAELGTRAFSSVERLLDEVEAVSVAVPTRDHHGIAMVALGRGRHGLRAAAPVISSPLSIRSERLAPFRRRGTDVAVALDLMIHDLDLVAGRGEFRRVSPGVAGAPAVSGRDGLAALDLAVRVLDVAGCMPALATV